MLSCICLGLLFSSQSYSFVQFKQTKEGDVIKCINNCGNNFKFTSLSMPNSRQDFVRKVLLEFGSYVEFLTIKHITGFELQVNQPSLKCECSKKLFKYPSLEPSAVLMCIRKEKQILNFLFFPVMTSHLENASSPDIPITFSSLSTVKLDGKVCVIFSFLML